MLGAVLPGNSTVELRDFPIPEPGHGQVLIETKSSTICGCDIRAIYREHLGKGPEGYQNKIDGYFMKRPQKKSIATLRKRRLSNNAQSPSPHPPLSYPAGFLNKT